MLFNRHFFIMIFSIFLIGIIISWQKPDTAVMAMTNSEYSSSPYSTIKNYWEKLDYRQFDLALKMTADSANDDHAKLEKTLKDNPLLSIQKIKINEVTVKNSFRVTVTFGSVINKKQEINYLVHVELSGDVWVITSIDPIS